MYEERFKWRHDRLFPTSFSIYYSSFYLSTLHRVIIWYDNYQLSLPFGLFIIWLHSTQRTAHTRGGSDRRQLSVKI